MPKRRKGKGWEQIARGRKRKNIPTDPRDFASLSLHDVETVKMVNNRLNLLKRKRVENQSDDSSEYNTNRSE